MFGNLTFGINTVANNKGVLSAYKAMGKLNNTVNRTTISSKNLNNSLSSVGGLVSKIGGMAGFIGVASVLSKATEEAREFEKVTKTIEYNLTKIPEGLRFTSDTINEFSKAQGKLGAASENNFKSAFKLATTFQMGWKDTSDFVKAAIDLAVQSSEDGVVRMEDANGVLKGMFKGSLADLRTDKGLAVSDAEIKIYNNLATKVEKNAMMMEIFERNAGGANKALKNTFGSRSNKGMEKLYENIRGLANIMNSFKIIMIDVANKLLSKYKPAIDAVSSSFGKLVGIQEKVDAQKLGDIGDGGKSTTDMITNLANLSIGVFAAKKALAGYNVVKGKMINLHALGLDQSKAMIAAEKAKVVADKAGIASRISGLNIDKQKLADELKRNKVLKNQLGFTAEAHEYDKIKANLDKRYMRILRDKKDLTGKLSILDKQKIGLDNQALALSGKKASFLNGLMIQMKNFAKVSFAAILPILAIIAVLALVYLGFQEIMSIVKGTDGVFNRLWESNKPMLIGIAILLTGIAVGIGALISSTAAIIAGVAVGVVFLTAFFLKLYKGNETAKKVFDSIWVGLKKLWDYFIIAIKGIGWLFFWLSDIIGHIVTVIIATIKGIWDCFVWLYDSSLKTWNWLCDALEIGIKATINFIVNSINGIINVFTTVKNSAFSIWEGMINLLTGGFDSFVTKIKGFLGDIKNTLIETFSNIGDLIMGSSIIDSFKTIFLTVKGFFVESFTNVMDLVMGKIDLSGFIDKMINNLLTAITSIYGAIKNVFFDIFGGMFDGIINFINKIPGVNIDIDSFRDIEPVEPVKRTNMSTETRQGKSVVNQAESNISNTKNSSKSVIYSPSIKIEAGAGVTEEQVKRIVKTQAEEHTAQLMNLQ